MILKLVINTTVFEAKIPKYIVTQMTLAAALRIVTQMTLAASLHIVTQMTLAASLHIVT
jgi:hypothetical protein